MSPQNIKKNLTNWDLVSVNPIDKNWDWKILFCFWGVNIQSVIGFSLIVSLYLIYDLNTFVVFTVTIIGTLLIYIFSNLIGKPSQKNGLPFIVLLRSSLGVIGAKYFGLIRFFVGTFLFGIQTYFLSKAFSYLIRISGFLFSGGMNLNNKIIIFSAITVYFGMLLFFLSVLLSDVKFTSQAFLNILNTENFLNKDNFGPLITVSSTVFAYFSVVILSFGDFSRYVKDESQLKKGNFSLILNLLIFSFFALFIVSGMDAFLKQDPENLNRILTNPTDILGKLDNLFLVVLALIFIIIASASTNLIVNFIPSQYTLVNFLPFSLSIRSAGLIISILGFIIGIFWLTFLSQVGALSFIDTFGAFFGPLFGIMISDFYFIQKSKINNKDIYSLENNGIYYYTGGWHIKGVYSAIIGFIFSASTIWNANLMFLQSFSWIIGAAIAAFTYYLLARE